MASAAAAVVSALLLLSLAGNAAADPTPTPSLAGCAPTPVIGCARSKRSVLNLRNDTDPSKTSFLWQWINGAADRTELGDPTTGTTNYALCVYDDGALMMTSALDAGGTCSNNKPCWKTSPLGVRRYRNPAGNADGITQATLKPSERRGGITIRARGAALPLPVTQVSDVTVQLVKNPGSGQECFEAVFPSPALTQTSDRFLDRIPPYVPVTTLGGDRPATVYVPASYKPNKPMPLLVLLHGYTANGGVEEFYMKLKVQAEAKGFLYLNPNGTIDSHGLRFWNATDACCNFDHSPVDDSAYISSLIAGVQALYNVDRKRIFIVGHSNGAFMAYRMACDHANQVAGIVSLAGAMWDDISLCNPSRPVSVLQIHGTADNTIKYLGGSIGLPLYPGAQGSVGDWVALDNCNPTPDLSPPPLDLESEIAGDETTVTRYADGCSGNAVVELWSIIGGAHVPELSRNFSPSLVDFLLSHPKP